jgi:outer membrane receptor for ferrienterochelin and colicin
MSQSQGVKGIVLETDPSGNIKALKGALVSWLHTGIGTSTDSLGVFILPATDKSDRILVNATGYVSDTILITKSYFVKVIMISKSKLGEVTISYERQGTEISFIDPWKTSIMNEKELFKSACCNLSESFETNPSVDVSYSDALTGTKQIQMLGLASQYTQLNQEVMPSTRGLASNFGFSYTPGTWINSIQLSKGTGSVVNGYESIAGVINVELHKPDVKEKMYFNAYGSEGGRYETNLILANKINPKFSHSVFLHASTLNQRMDRNNDGFLDNPLGYQLNGMYRFKYDNLKGFILQGALRALQDKKSGGAMGVSDDMQYSVKPQIYGTQVKAERYEGFLKMGYVFEKKRYKGIGLQVNASNQNYDNFFGVNKYNGTEKSVYSNLIYQSIISNTNHKFRTGISYVLDDYNEKLYNKQEYNFKRNENVSGAFFEYTYSYLAKFTLVAGNRIDYHNLFGWYWVPRLHARYAFNENTVLRASAGKGWRTPNLIAENSGILASSRQWIFPTNYDKNVFGFEPEVAWNYGINLTHDFKLNYRKGTFSIDYYYSDFTKQVVVDRDANAQQILFYQLDGASYSNSLQVQLDYQPFKRFDVRLAYRWYAVKTSYQQGLLEVPMIAAHRAFVNLAYQTKDKWTFDLTAQWFGQKRLPNTQSNPGGLKLANYSDAYFIFNSQISKSLFQKKLDLYVGLENIFDFKQNNPIIDGANPFSSYFDASMVWAPVFGRMIYAGLRLKI